MTFVQNIVVAFGLLVSFSFSWAVCPVGVFFFLLILFILKSLSETHSQEKELRKYERREGDCGITMVTFNHRANRLFVRKGKLAILCILLTLLGSIICNEASATPKLSVWEGRTTRGKCTKEKVNVYKANASTAEAETKAGRPLQAAKIIRELEVGLYSHCLRKEFKKVLTKKIDQAGKLAVGDETLHAAAFFDNKFIQVLINTGHYLESKGLKKLAKMALSFHVKDGKLGVLKNYVFIKEVKPIKLP